jgi:hypothetical protein
MRRIEAAMLAYVTVGADDLTVAAAFYDAILAPLGFRRLKTTPHEIGYGPEPCRFWIVKPFDGGKASFCNGVDIAFRAPSPDFLYWGPEGRNS